MPVPPQTSKDTETKRYLTENTLNPDETWEARLYLPESEGALARRWHSAEVWRTMRLCWSQ